jgi:uncharacterized protein YjeT (DUF2065 family)
MIIVVTTTTLALAKAIGIYAIAAGVGGLVAPERWRAMIEEMRTRPGLAYVTGAFTFALGAAIVLVHNVWTDPLAIAVSLIGWAAAVEGVILLVMPEPLLKFGASMVRPAAARPYAIVAVVFGAGLLIAGVLGRAGPAL